MMNSSQSLPDLKQPLVSNKRKTVVNGIQERIQKAIEEAKQIRYNHSAADTLKKIEMEIPKQIEQPVFLA